ncbi:methyl-accepting chemotaxis protein [Desulfoluna spongiiphila]|uniref:Methyl-accepting chemotaxis protein n=1 Tax=Desulfoluna spongiiphila TaxID=419481 RepID=A0A1G5CV70_9BACT|nr:methyl-accepting chemotaxis protein [Desulfoluna spongiiphila]SCY06284.1 Methyl-accepting chemotaxis protein [Desulfoluna spongiiphila]
MERLKSFFQSLKIGTKLSFGIVSMIIVVMAALLMTIINSYRANLIANSHELMLSSIQRVAQSTEADISATAQMVRATAISQATGVFGDREGTLEQIKAGVKAFPSCFGIAINYEPNADGQDEAYVEDSVHTINGRFLPFYYWKDGLKRDEMVPSKSIQTAKGWYQVPKKKANEMLAGSDVKDLMHYSDVYLTRGVPTVSIVHPIIVDRAFKGVVSVDMSMINAQVNLKKLKPYQTAKTFLVSAKGTILAGELFGDKKVGAAVYDEPGYNDAFFRFFKEHTGGMLEQARASDGKEIYYVFSLLPTTGMVVGMAVEKSEIVAPINALIAKISVGAVVAVLFCLGVVWLVARRIVVRPVNNIMNLFSEIGIGNFTARADVMSGDELGIMAESLNAMLDNTLSLIQSREERDAIQDSVMKLLTEISGLTEGDLTVRAEVTEDMTGAIADSFNLMAEQIGQVVREVKTAAGRVTETSGVVHESTEKLAETSTLQAEQITGAIGAIRAMADTIRRVAGSAVQSAEVSEQSTVSAREGAEAVSKTNASMAAIRENVQETARAIKRLGESSQEIGNIVQIIGDIADRTSILALNASIQAAMAGDAGRGFAVVAEEVQRLAERSTNSTKQIDTLVKNIQGEITEAGASMDASIQRVVEGSQRADDAHTKLEEIRDVSGELAILIGGISQTSEEQAKESEKITRAMESIGAISVDTSEASLATAARMNEMEETAQAMMGSIAAFTVDEA